MNAPFFDISTVLSGIAFLVISISPKELFVASLHAVSKQQKDCTQVTL